MNNTRKLNTRNMVLLAILTAIVFALQMLAVVIKLGPFSITLVLMPIAIGAALVGVYAGAWLGFVFGFAVLLSGDAAAFFVINAPAAVLVVLAKGILAGLAAGLAYRIFDKLNRTFAAIAAAVICPVVNTGVFVIGSYLFFMDTITEWGAGAGFESGTAFLFVGMIGVNFLFELALNLILSPVIIRLIQYGELTWRKKPA